MKAVITNKSAVVLHGLKPGASKHIEVDELGVPLDKNWRRRQADAKIDGAVEIKIEEKKPAKAKKTEEVE